MPENQHFVEANSSQYILVESMGSTHYLSAINLCACVVGNSSSGLIEAPSFGKPTVNVGERQRGRIKSSSVIDCLAEATDILKAIRQSQSSGFQRICLKRENVYGEPGAALKTLKIIKDWDFKDRYKQFYDQCY